MINYKDNVFEIIYIIVNCGLASKILHKAKEYGISGGTILLGRGTYNNSFFKSLSIFEDKKEVIILGTDRIKAEEILSKLNKDFKFNKNNHGIAFKINACDIIGSRTCNCGETTERRSKKNMYKLIIAIVNKGSAELVMESVSYLGIKSGTIINARGSGINETSKLFSMDIEPEKETVMIVVKNSIVEDAVESIREKLELDKPGKGIIFIQNINKVYGIHE